MTQSEHRILQNEQYVAEADLKLRLAREKCEIGIQKLALEAKEKTAELRNEIGLAIANLERAKASLVLAKAEGERGFEQ